MLKASVLALAFAGTLCSFVPQARASSAGAEAAAPVGPNEVRTWLMRIHAAASRRNFQGTFIVSAGGGVSSARIAHYNDGHNQLERIESLDGETRFVFRHNDEVRTLWPEQRVALIEQRDLLTSFPALLQVRDDRIVDFYEVRARPPERVAGYEANVLILRPRDAHRFGYRLWADRASGLLLRADVVGADGELLESSAFSDVTIDVRSQPETVLQPMNKLDGYRTPAPRAHAHPPRCRRLEPASCRARFPSRELCAPADARHRIRARRRSRHGAADHLLRRPHLCVGIHRAFRCRTPRHAPRDLDRRHAHADAAPG